eukprot:TRINITY_DN5183_c0_g1_i1.p1 TRINITY_DN5183_c0_g1~~TRINITY_DN5183_c0_g1_i1.p1  ORF type:complete len:130 (+),score=9.98 TRINITY_DN5183_c0_g1_i1:57-446(+)
MAGYVEGTVTILVVEGLPTNADASAIKAHFSLYGRVQTIRRYEWTDQTVVIFDSGVAAVSAVHGPPEFLGHPIAMRLSSQPKALLRDADIPFDLSEKRCGGFQYNPGKNRRKREQKGCTESYLKWIQTT